MATKTALIMDGDALDVCKRGMQILRERGLNFEVEDREDVFSINEVFEANGLGYEIQRTGLDWYEVVRTGTEE